MQNTELEIQVAVTKALRKHLGIKSAKFQARRVTGDHRKSGIWQGYRGIGQNVSSSYGPQAWAGDASDIRIDGAQQ
jgi:hypothetical protein